jgi:hypothetical protein
MIIGDNASYKSYLVLYLNDVESYKKVCIFYYYNGALCILRQKIF